MNYPDNFETSTFPAGTRIAASRTAAIGIAVVYVLIVFACGLLLWASRSVRISPFLIATNEIPTEWRIVGQGGGTRRVATHNLLQEALIAKYIQRRFYISAFDKENENLWNVCERPKDCTTIGNTSTGSDCALFCATSAEEFVRFQTMIVPDYRERVAMGEQQWVSAASIRLVPTSDVSVRGGMWRASFTIESNISTPIRVIAYARVARDQQQYPRTMGYYITDFNAYRLDLDR